MLYAINQLFLLLPLSLNTSLTSCTYALGKCSLQRTVCSRGSCRLGRGLPVIWIALYMWGQYVQRWSVCQGLRWGLLWERHPLCTPPSLCKRLYKADGGRSTFVTLLSDTETITLSLDTQTLWTLAILGHILRKEALPGTGSSPCWAFWLDWKRGEETYSWTTPSITSPVRVRASGTVQTFGNLAAAQPWRSSTCSTCSCCLWPLQPQSPLPDQVSIPKTSSSRFPSRSSFVRPDPERSRSTV